MRIAFVVLATMSLGVALAGPMVAGETATDTLSVRWEELTAPDFARAVLRSNGTAIVPLGIIEKHGPHLPLGTDLLDVRALVERATKEEYSLVFPPYYFGQIFEARHQPGTVAYSQKLIWDLLQETVDEIARNGIKKIILRSNNWLEQRIFSRLRRHTLFRHLLIGYRAADLMKQKAARSPGRLSDGT